jgi:pentatricopeptide repeat protein
MNQRKHFIIILVLSGMAASACGGAKKTSTAQGAAKTSLDMEPVSMPKEVSSANRRVLEKTLYLMPAEHPQRRELRDRIAKSVADEFDKTDEKKSDVRLGLFEEGLHLHEPQDFSPGKVSEELIPMATWASKTYAERGEEAVVLAALKYLSLARPSERKYEEQYLELLDWSTKVRDTIVEKIQRIGSLIDLFTEMMELVPDLNVAHRTAALHLERYKLIQSLFQGGIESDPSLGDPSQILLQGRAAQNMPLNIIHLFFLAGDPSLARVYLEELTANGELSPAYLEMLDRIYMGEKAADAYFSLAGSLMYFDPRAALRAFILARRQDPKNHRYAMNIGLLFDELDCSLCAVEFYLETQTLDPSEETTTKVLSLTDRSLQRLHFQEDVEGAKKIIERADRLVETATKAFPDEDTELTSAAAGLLYTMGEVDFDDGRVDDAIRHFTKSDQVHPNVPALIKLSEVNFLLNRFEPAAAALKSAKEVDIDGNEGADYLKALILEKEGDILVVQKRQTEAEAAYKSSLVILDAGGEMMDGSPSAALQRGFILHQLKDLKGSEEAFLLAIRLDPDRAETYGTLISFLVVEGRLEDAVEIYRLAYNQDRIKDMWKIYYSLWVEGLSRRMGKGSVSLAGGYLQAASGDTWQDHLARFFTKKISLGELRKAAANRGQLVEADFYGAIIALCDGKKDEARNLLKSVIASDLLGFFEYRMARALLQNELTSSSN